MNRLSGASCLLGLICLGGVIAAESRIIQKPRYNADAPPIDLFDGVESGALAVRMMPRDENGGAIFIENRTAGPLTIELPDAFVGVQVLPQFSLQVPLNGGTTTGAQPQGQNQPVGGNANSTGNGIGSGNNGAPPGFFSVPAERTARIPYSSVCLRHGAVAPRLGNTYQLVRVEKFSSDPRLARLLARVGQGDESQEAHQAAPGIWPTACRGKTFGRRCSTTSTPRTLRGSPPTI